jgi:hypothetical protein
VLSFSSFVFDKAIYAPGDPIQLTVNYTSDDLDPGTSVSTPVTATLSDAAGTVTQTSDSSAAFLPFVVEVPSGAPMITTISVSDPRPGVWTLVSNAFSGSAAPFQGVAVLTSVA